jgi:hypothetical protein
MSVCINRRFVWLTIILIAIASVLSLASSIGMPVVKPDLLSEALQRARLAGSYKFTCDVTQVKLPAISTSNIGRSSQTQQIHMEGQTDLASQTMQMRLWNNQGSVMDPSSGVAIKVENGKTYIQQRTGPWHEQAGLTDRFAPQGDFFAYLTAMREPEAHPVEEINGIRFVRYTFRLDGPTLGSYMLDQLEDELRSQGQLPSGMELQVPAYYREMTGNGELWVGSDGLPLRQILRMHFPEQAGESVYAEAITNYTDFGDEKAHTRWGGLLSPVWSPQKILGPALILLGMFAFCVLLLHPRSHSHIWRILAAVLIVLLILNPLLTDLQTAKAFSALNERNQAEEQQRAEASQQEDLLSHLAEPRIDPHADPLAGATAGAAVSASVNAFVAKQSAPTYSTQALPLADEDADRDGLTDMEEQSVGTDPTYADTDEDGIGDAVEVKGFELSGQHWYMDALRMDSNQDSITDIQEYDFNADGQPDDTNGNDIPDVFDRDNDGDGVPDDKDLAPFSALPAVFSDASPFQLIIDGLMAEVPTFVDFQIRPENIRHLWFAFNVLDWPEDNKGVVQDIDNATFATLNGRTDSNNANGDMKLIPMLEIRMPDGGANLPDQHTLEPYGINITDLNDDGSEKAAYVPLSLISDDQTGQRVAFGGRMPFVASGSWPQPYEVRLVWLVQVLLDIPCQTAEQDGCGIDEYKHNVPQVIHTYYDSFQLTGLNVKEDHGARVAIIYEDPQLQPDQTRIDNLTILAGGLEESFLSSRSLIEVGKPDVDLAEIIRRFNYPAECSGAECWGLKDTLRVERHDYATLDQSINDIATIQTNAVLNTHFTPLWQADKPSIPLLMYAQEVHSRALSMDVLGMDNSAVSASGSTLTMNLDDAPMLGINSVKWTPYCGANNPSTVTWSPCLEQDWLNYVEQNNSGADPNDPADDSQLARGRVMALYLFSVILQQAITRVVSIDGQLIHLNGILMSDGDFTENIKSAQGAISGVKSLTVFVSNFFLLARFEGIQACQEFLRRIAELRDGNLGHLWRAYTSLVTGYHITRGSAAMFTCVSFALIGLIGFLAYEFYEYVFDSPNPVATWTVHILLLVISAYSLLSPLLAVRMLVTVLGQSLRSALGACSEILGASRAAARIGMIIGIVLTWGVFLYSIISNGVPAFSLEFDRAAAEALAATTYLVILTLLAASVWGLILVAVIFVVDAIAAMVCLASQTAQCFSIGGAVVNFITWLFYSSKPMVEPTIVPGNPQISLVDRNKGYAAGNSLNVTIPLTTNIVHQDPSISDSSQIHTYPWLFSADNLKSSTIRYSLTSPGNETIPVSLNQMNSEWQNVVEDHGEWIFTKYRGSASASPTLWNYPLQAGINRPVDFYFNSSYAIPAYECFGILFVSGCWTRELKGNNSTHTDSLVVDVFPDSLDGFMTLSWDSNEGASLGWDDKFPALRDADGDGLISKPYNGPDPNDLKWDTDGDGLSDYYELQQREQSRAYSAYACDTDQDGLSDKQEAWFGTDPSQTDTDRDGLSDSQEVVHQVVDSSCQATSDLAGGWQVQIPHSGKGYSSEDLTITVQSNPLVADTDGDTLSDLEEKTLAEGDIPDLDTEGRPFLPYVVNAQFLLVSAELSQTIARPGDSLDLTTTVETHTTLSSPILTVNLPDILGNAQTYPLDFSQSPKLTQRSTLSVPLGMSSQNVTIQGTVHAILGGNASHAVTAGTSTVLVIDADLPAARLTGLSDGQYLTGSTIQIVGGAAEDASTGVARVEVQVNDGTWLDANGTNAWSFPFTVQEEGPYQICVRATDHAGNVQENPACLFVYIDSTAPTVTFAHPSESPVVPGRASNGQWTVPIDGSVFDPPIPGHMGSGLDSSSMEVRLASADETNPVTGDWQPVSIDTMDTTQTKWLTNYAFPSTVTDATGAWYIELRAADKLGNIAQAKSDFVINLDSDAPHATLSDQDASRDYWDATTEIRGAFLDTSVSPGGRMEIAFVPVSQAMLSRDAVLWLSFDEPANTSSWSDLSGMNHTASCNPGGQTGKDCPTTGQAGRVDGGLAFQVDDEMKSGTVVVSATDDLNIEMGAGFSVQAWVKTNRPQGSILDKLNIYRLWISDGKPVFEISNPDGSLFVSASAKEAVADNAWHHLVATFEPATGRAVLYVDGQISDESGTSQHVAGATYASADPLYIGSPLPFSGMIDELAIFNHALSALDVKALFESASVPWQAVNLQNAGTDPARSTWSMKLPESLEGIYQVNLRTWDALGNHAVTANVWNGPIDTLAPRLTLTATVIDSAYLSNQSSKGVYSLIRFSCAAQDIFLDEATFQCPADNLPPALPTYYTDSFLDKYFPDLTLVGSLTSEWTQWQQLGTRQQEMRACDKWGNCSSKVSEAVSVAEQEREPVSVAITAPSEGVYAAGPRLQVQVSANVLENNDPLKTVTLALDGVTRDTQSYPADREIYSADYTIDLLTDDKDLPITEGSHTLIVTATNSAKNSQTATFVTHFLLDAYAPTVMISTTRITRENAYLPGSPVLRFSGTASDTVCLASVQLSVDGGEFVPATLENGQWTAAVYVNTPEGRTLSTTARAVDCAGHTSETTKDIPTYLTLPEEQAPDTRITGTPGLINPPGAAAFTFVGVKHLNPVAALMCQLDEDPYKACTSPYNPGKLSLGMHTLKVRAVDNEGNFDPTPASFTWRTVNSGNLTFLLYFGAFCLLLGIILGGSYLFIRRKGFHSY